jgi:Zn finger protein HypA/HybF involved in hydrogenase expression
MTATIIFRCRGCHMISERPLDLSVRCPHCGENNFIIAPELLSEFNIEVKK